MTDHNFSQIYIDSYDCCRVCIHCGLRRHISQALNKTTMYDKDIVVEEDISCDEMIMKQVMT